MRLLKRCIYERCVSGCDMKRPALVLYVAGTAVMPHLSLDVCSAKRVVRTCRRLISGGCVDWGGV